MRTKDLQLLPRFADSLTFIYVERARIEQDQYAIVLVDESARVVGTLSQRVRERLWSIIQGRKHLGSCIMVARAQNEQGFSIATNGESPYRVVDLDGLQLVSRTRRPRIKEPPSGGSVTPAKPAGDVCGGDPHVVGPVEAETLRSDPGHPVRTVWTENGGRILRHVGEDE